jgi:alkanesulfonate monooxygenase SsuD/methylene tetrahydromethanopterin reductase-like flavin-dependent oxidoreductase (luciferase family)
MRFRPLILCVSLNGAGHHPAAWRTPGARSTDALNGARFLRLAGLAEAGGLDIAMLGYPARGSALASPDSAEAVRLDALSLAAALIAGTRSIGLAAVAPATYLEPFNVARAFSALDLLSRGRAAWCVDGAWREHDRGDFSRLAAVDSDTLEARTGEFLDVVFALWDSWDEGSLVFDKANAIFTDHTKVRRIDHLGAFFKVEGPLNSPRPAQGRPVIIHTDSASGGLVAETADVVLLSPSTMTEAAERSRSMKASANALGRELVVLADIVPILDHAGASGEARRAALDALGGSGEGLTFAGSPTGLADLMQAWTAAGACDGFNLRPAVFPDDLLAFVDGVVPALRRQRLIPGDRIGATLRERLGLAQPASRYALATHG